MAHVRQLCLAAVVWGISIFPLIAQCPDRPAPGTAVQDPYAIQAQGKAVQASLSLGYSVDNAGFSHYCYQYQSPGGVVESPTLRVSPGDTLQITLSDVIQDKDASKMTMHSSHSADHVTCGDGGPATVSSTNMHFHGMPVQPVCHQDDVINTVLQPGGRPFQYSIPIPADTPPGLYWYHPHIHGFTEFQVNGGAAGSLIVEGMEKVRPEVQGLTERVFVIRQQYLVPWIPGPYDLTINYQIANFPDNPAPIIYMRPGEKQFWRVANATLQDFMPLQVLFNGNPVKLQLIALDGYPLSQTRDTRQILVPPAGRAEFIVEAPANGASGQFVTGPYNTGPTGNADLSKLLAIIQTPTQPALPSSVNANGMQTGKSGPFTSATKLKWSDSASRPVTAQRGLFFSEQFGGTNGPIQFYLTVDGQQQKVFDPNEEPVIKTKVGAVEEWTVENRSLETHAFHIHQIHFKVLEVNGKAPENSDILDTITIPFWPGKGPYPSVKLLMDFSDPTIAGTFVMHCHILLHEDLGMMHKIEVDP